MKSAVPHINCTYANMDFEPAALAAWAEVYPEVDIHGCRFHFDQAIQRNIGRVGLQSQYRENENGCKDYVKKIHGLSLIPPTDVAEAWVILNEDRPDLKNSAAKLEEFENYFMKTWLENPTYPIYLWNNHNIQDKTNNIAEGLHSKLLSYQLPKTPNIYFVILVLQDLEFEACRRLRQDEEQRKYAAEIWTNKKLEEKIQSLQYRYNYFRENFYHTNYELYKTETLRVLKHLGYCSTKNDDINKNNDEIKKRSAKKKKSSANQRRRVVRNFLS